MMEITAMGLGLMMTTVAVAIAGLLLEATLMILNRSLRTPAAIATPNKPVAII